jgi:polar amino acid transport system substrate-binding protein
MWVDRVKYILVFAALCVFSFKLFAQTIVTNEKLNIVTENWFPFNYVDDKGEITGQSTEYVERLFREANIDYTIELLPWTRALNIAETRKNTAIYTILKTSEREPLFDWLCPIAQKKIHHVYKLTSRQDIKLDSEEQLKNYSIAVTRKTFLHEYMLEQGLTENTNLLLTADDKLNITLFLAGRVDLLAEFEGNITQILGDAGLDITAVQAVFAIPTERYPDYCLAINKQTADSVIKQLHDAQQRLLPE